MSEIEKIVIANRGEIALRIIRTCRDLAIETVALYSLADESAPHVLLADESICIGEAPAIESYLSIEKVIEAAKRSGADALHPGYGFLSENAAFAERCREEGILFIGPAPETIRLMGDKMLAREMVEASGIPCPPGSPSALETFDAVRREAAGIGYPVLIKAAAGGGGKGMRIVSTEKELESGFRGAVSEADHAFGDGRVYIEKYLESPRHVEFQVMADQQGNLMHLYDRECSIQRRHQKVIEEAPCSFLSDELRDEMSAAAISVAKACSYVGAGTIEFLVDADHNFYFLEMNTRLQVEHPVTELVTGVDLVALQILVAEGKRLPFKQEDVTLNGHAIECRIYAEDPANHFLPDTGVLKRHRVPGGPGVRVDAGVEEGGEVTIHYDPMISKLSVYAASRKLAIAKMARALDEYEISGCRTTIPFCSFVMQHHAFIEGNYDTHFVEREYEPDIASARPETEVEVAAVAAACLIAMQAGEETPSDGYNHQTVFNNWWRNRRKL